MQSKRAFLIDTGFWLLWSVAAVSCFVLLYQHAEPVIQLLVALLGGMFFGLVAALAVIRYRDLSDAQSVQAKRRSRRHELQGEFRG